MENIEEYTRDVVTKCVIKICWALGFTSLSSVSAQVLTDITNRYMKDMCVSLHQYMNVYGHLSPTLGDCSLTMLSLAVTVNNLEDFAQNVFPILLDEKIPQYPIQSQPKLNFLKPGSREVVTRPVHIHEHLPAMYPDVSDEDNSSNFDARSSSLDVIGNLESGSGSSTAINGGLPNLSGNCDLFKRTATSSGTDQETASPTSSSSGLLKKSKMTSEERVQPTRELSCVVMTTSGFLTTKREGKMPEARIPLTLTNFTVVNNAPIGSAETNSGTATPAKSGEQLKVKQSSSSNSSSNNNNNNNNNNNSNNSNSSSGARDGVVSCKPPPEKKMKLAEEQPTKELSVSREQQPEQQEDRPHSVKTTATKSGTKTATSLEITSSLPSGSPPSTDAFKSKQPVRTVPHSPTSPIKTQKQSLSDRRDSEDAEERETVVDGKLTSEPDRVKLSIFKKITKSRDDSKVAALADQSSSGGNAASASNVKETELTGSKKSHHKDQAAEVSVANDTSGSVVKGSGKAQVVKVKKLTKAGKLSKRQKKLKHLSVAAEKMKKKKSQQTIEASSPPLSSSSSPMEAKKDIIKPAVPMNNSNQPPPPIYPFLSSFTSGAGSLLPTSLSQNPLIPKFVPFPSAPLSGKLNPHTPAVPHPAMPNLPLPPPGMMQVISDDRSKTTSKGHGGSVAATGGVEFETETSHDPDEEPPTQAAADTKKLKKEHKKLKKDKKDREKKKKEKRDKVKNVKKLKTGKNKREKNSQKDDKLTAVDSNETVAKLPPVEVVPKLKLKLGSASPQLSSSSSSTVAAATSVASQSPKITIKPIVKKTANEFRREPSPELAKINALVGKPVKHKSTDSSSSSKFNLVDPIMINVPPAPATPSTTSSKKQQEKTRSRAVKEKSSSGRGKRSSAAALETNEPKHAPFYYDDDGNQIWVCPSCGAQDDGSPMIGCDGCDAWYHWVCVGIKSAPESAKWFCSFCRRK